MAMGRPLGLIGPFSGNPVVDCTTEVLSDHATEDVPLVYCATRRADGEKKRSLMLSAVVEFVFMLAVVDGPCY
jgi:hypothetical protein